MSNIDTCKCDRCSLQFTADCIKSEAFLAKIFDQKRHESIEEIMIKLAKEAFNWVSAYKVELIDIISRYVPRYGYLGIIKINDEEIFRSGEFKETPQEAVDHATTHIEKTLLNFIEAYKNNQKNL